MLKKDLAGLNLTARSFGNNFGLPTGSQMSPQVDLNPMQPGQNQTNNNNNSHAEVSVKTEATQPQSSSIIDSLPAPSPASNASIHAPSLQPTQQSLNANNLMQMSGPNTTGNPNPSNAALSQLSFGNLYIQSKKIHHFTIYLNFNSFKFKILRALISSITIWLIH